jgi:hypothetical protein
VIPVNGGGVEGAAASVIGDKIYVSHGYSFGDTRKLRIYTISTNSWAFGPDAAVVRSELAGASVGGKHYAIGGRNPVPGTGDAVEIYDPATNLWSTGASMPTPRAGLCLGVLGGKIHAIGGRTGSTPNTGTPLAAHEVYDPVADSWSPAAPLPVAVGDNYACTALLGKMYVFGGYVGGAVTSITQIYDPASDTWSIGAPMPTARSNAIAGVLDCHPVVIGGVRFGGSNLRTVEIYHPDTDSWTVGPPKPTAGSEFGASMPASGSEIFAVGSGISGASQRTHEALAGVGAGCDADVELVAINKGQPKRAVECAAPGPFDEVHAGNGRALAFDPDYNHLFYTEAPWDVIYKVDPSNAQPQGGVPQVCRLVDSCPIFFPDGTPMPIGAMAYQDREEFDPPAPFDILWLAPYDGAGFGGIGDVWQLAIDTDSADQFYPQRDAGLCFPTLVTFAPLGRGPQCPDIGVGFPDGMDFDPSPDIPGLNSIWISDDASDLVQRLIFPESPALTYKQPFPAEISEHSIHKCNTGIAIDPTGGANPVWLNEYAIDFRTVHIEEVYLSQRPRQSLHPRVFEAAAYDMGLFGAHPRDLGVKNARAWEDSEFDETRSFSHFGHRCGVWTVDNATTILRSGEGIGSNEILLVRFDVPCGKDETETLELGERVPISLTKKIHNNGPADPVDVLIWDGASAPESCDVSYHTQDAEEIVIAAGVPYFRLLDDGTLVPLGVGPASMVPGPSHTIVAQGTPDVDFELEVHTLLPGSVPVSVPVNFHEEFDKRCSDGGIKLFDFCVEVMPAEVEDPNPDNNQQCITEIVEICDPAPLTQGYWHRQCLGEGLITPGRNGRGPKEPTEPDFDKLLPVVDALLQAKVFMFRTCEDGIATDAPAPSDPCERALKQYTALLLNIASGRLQGSCAIDLSALGCSSTDISDLVDELAGLYNSGDPDACKVVAACAGAINEGEGLVFPAAAMAPLFGTTSAAAHSGGVESEPVSTAPTDEPDTTSAPEAYEGAGDAPVSSSAPQGGATPYWKAATPAKAAESAAGNEPASSTAGQAYHLTAAESTESSEAAAEASPAEAETIEEHLAVLAEAAADGEARKAAEEALLTALGGGYEPEVRMRIVRALADKVDAALHSLLAGHLEDIRSEARDAGKDDQAAEAEELLKKLEASE